MRRKKKQQYQNRTTNPKPLNPESSAVIVPPLAPPPLHPPLGWRGGEGIGKREKRNETVYTIVLMLHVFHLIPAVIVRLSHHSLETSVGGGGQKRYPTRGDRYTVVGIVRLDVCLCHSKPVKRKGKKWRWVTLLPTLLMMTV